MIMVKFPSCKCKGEKGVLNIMKRLRIMVAVWLLLFLALPAKAQGNDQIPNQDWIKGTYQVVVKAGHFSPYSVEVAVTRVNSQTVKLSGDIDGLPICIYGRLVPGKSSTDKAMYNFIIHNDLFAGQITATFKKKGKNSEISGYGGGAYAYMGSSGKCRGTFAGIGHSSIGVNKYFIVVLVLAAFIILFCWRRRKRTSYRQG